MIHLIVGNTGSGKTTYSTILKAKTSGIIFSIDKWNKTLFLADKKPDDGLEWFLERIDRAEKIIMELVRQLEYSKTDSILDFPEKSMLMKRKDFHLTQKIHQQWRNQQLQR